MQPQTPNPYPSHPQNQAPHVAFKMEYRTRNTHTKHMKAGVNAWMWVCRLCKQNKEHAKEILAQEQASHPPVVAGARRQRDDGAEDDEAELVRQREAAIKAAVVEKIGETVWSGLANDDFELEGGAGVFRPMRASQHLNAAHPEFSIDNDKDGQKLLKHFNVKTATSARGAQTTITTAFAVVKAASDQRALLVKNPLARNLTPRECQTFWAARKYISFESFDDPFFKKAFANADFKCGEADKPVGADYVSKDIRDGAGKFSDEVYKAVFARRFVCIAIDAGTVWDRYLATMVHAIGESRSMVFDLRPDFEIDPLREIDHCINSSAVEFGRLTAENMANYLKPLIAKFESDYNLLVVAVSSDNAANMLNLCEQMSMFDSRCACHGIQLIVAEATAARKEHTDAMELVESMVSELRSLPSKTLDKHGVSHIRPPQETRWNSKLKLLRDVQAALDTRKFTRDDQSSILNSLPNPRQRQQIDNLVECLARFETATKLCESDTSNMLDTICAVGVMELPKHFGETERQSENLYKQFRVRILSAPLVVAAYFAGCHSHAMSPWETSIVEFIKVVMQSKISERILQRFGHTVSQLVLAFDNFLRHGRAKRHSFSKRAYEDEILKLRSGKAPSLPRLTTEDSKILGNWLWVVTGVLASEASAERCFRRLKLTVPTDRKSLKNETCEAAVKVNVASGFFLQAQESLEQKVPVAVDAETNDNTNENEQLSGAAFSDACDLILSQASIRLKNIAATSAAGAAEAKSAPTARNRCMAWKYDDEGNRTERCSKAFVTGHPITDHKYVMCIKCKSFSSTICLNLSPVVEKNTWRCEDCVMKGVEPAFF